jgi:choline kinase
MACHAGPSGSVAPVKIVILAAGVGSRLGNPFPKPLTLLSDGRSIMQRQIDTLEEFFNPRVISVVVGFKKDMVMEAFPDASFIYNQNFGETNTSKSLLKGLCLTGPESVLWLNGDVVFDGNVIELLLPHIAADRSFVAVNTEPVAEEEVKYNLDDSGYIRELSKGVSEPLGEAVGINYVSSADKSFLATRLEDCAETDYFERGIELTIESDNRSFLPVDVSDAMCIEVDFEEDLARANDAIR